MRDRVYEPPLERSNASDGASCDTPSMALGVAVIGTGGMGGRHAMNLHRHVKTAHVAAIVDPDTARATEVADAIGARVAADAEDVITAVDVDAIVVASPDRTHASLALACIAAGKPALIEKPLGISADEAMTVVDAETTEGRRLIQVGLMRYFDRQHRDVAAMLNDGAIGRPVMFRGWHRNPPEDPRPTTRHVVFNAAVHDLYSARWLLDAEPTRVFAAGAVIDPDASDQKELQVITMEMSNGTIAVIEVNKDSGFGYEVGIELVGSDGTVTSAPHHTPTLRRGAAMAQRVEPDWLERFEQAYVAEVRAWIESIHTGVPVGPSAWDGYATLVAAEAVDASLESGTAVDITVGERPALYN